jgi:DNA polymerase/3'-5' exonuclease PolX
MNDEIIKILEQLAQIADLRGEVHRAKAYAGAVLGLRTLSWTVRENPDRVAREKIPGVGKGIRAKLTEYAKTGKVEELIALENSKDVRAYTELSKIAGAGPKTVAEWIGAGIFSITDLRKRLAVGAIELTPMQKYGLTYYNDLNSRIPRESVREIGEDIIARVHKLDPAAGCEIVGSYRRGAQDSGDIDIITTGKYSLRDLIARLEDEPNFIAVFMLGEERATFIGKYDGKVRQIDVLRLKPDQYWTGILYFTGSWEFNAAMRGYARRAGYLLNQRGLFKLRGRAEVLVKVGSEQEIFENIGLKYVEPRDRIGVANIVPKK